MDGDHRLTVKNGSDLANQIDQLVLLERRDDRGIDSILGDEKTGQWLGPHLRIPHGGSVIVNNHVDETVLREVGMLGVEEDPVLDEHAAETHAHVLVGRGCGQNRLQLDVLQADLARVDSLAHLGVGSCAGRKHRRCDGEQGGKQAAISHISP